MIMKTTKFILILLFAVFCNFAFSQSIDSYSFTGIITGTVKDESGKVLKKASVMLEAYPDKVAFTDSKGRFVLRGIPSDTLSLIFTFEGKETVFEKINKRNDIEIVMNSKFSEPMVVDTIAEEVFLEVEDDIMAIDGLESAPSVEYEIEESSAFLFSRSIADGKASSTSAPAYSGDVSKSDAYVLDYDLTESITDKKSKGESDVVGGYTETNVKSGMLTAGEVHDFSKWDLWTDITEDQLSQYKAVWEIYPLNRYCVQLTSKDGKPLIDTKVELKNQNGITLWSAKTDNTGKAELWGGIFDENYKEDAGNYISIDHQKNIYSISNPKKFHDGVNVLSIKSECKIPTNVDIAFVVDATGSMSDEINYLKAELQDIIERAGKEHSDLTFNLGSVFYRDNGDAYLTIKSDLSSDISKTIEFIKAQYAGGGGDFPEAVDAGLDAAINQLVWSESAIAKICFLVLDAPPHENAEVKANLERITTEAANKGIRIVPVTCSGIDKSTEYLMRSMALATNGTYVFLTDDSGIGGSHIKPTTDKYEVEYLNGLILRLINQYVLTPTCDNKLAIDEETIKDTSYVVNDEILVDVNISENDSTNLITDNTDIEDNSDNTDIQDVPYDYSKGIKYYPNPTSGVLNIELEGDIKELYLADNSGKLLERYIIEDEEFLQFDLSSYPSGMYFIQYLNKDKWKAGQVVLIRY